MITMQEWKTKRTMVLKDNESVKRRVLEEAGWREVPPLAIEPSLPVPEGKTEEPAQKETPPPPVLAPPESPTASAPHMGGVFEVGATEGGEGPFVEIAAEVEGEGPKIFEEGNGDAQKFFGGDFAGEGESVIEVVTEADKEALEVLEEEPAAEVEVLPEPAVVVRKGRGRPVGTKKNPAHTWSGNLPE